jgi:aerobic-type carbon monoxide dehydrogenase small subunit (CoxS/CutS family)
VRLVETSDGTGAGGAASDPGVESGERSAGERGIEQVAAPRRSGLSRRELLQGGAAAGALGGLGLLDADAAGKKGKKRGGKKAAESRAAEREALGRPLPEISGPGPVKIRLRVNDERVDLEVEPQAKLLEVLRDELGLTGAKEVCGRGGCGACTVLLDGRPVHACTVLAVTAHRGAVDTIEGLSRPRDLHPLPAAFVAARALQCGFCTPGFVMAAVALLDRNPLPKPAEVDLALAGNLCRCGCYPAIRQAVLDAAPLLVDEPRHRAEDEPPPQEPDMPPGGER